MCYTALYGVRTAWGGSAFLALEPCAWRNLEPVGVFGSGTEYLCMVGCCRTILSFPEVANRYHRTPYVHQTCHHASCNSKYAEAVTLYSCRSKIVPRRTGQRCRQDDFKPAQVSSSYSPGNMVGPFEVVIVVGEIPSDLIM